MFNLELRRSNTKFESVARKAHICIGLAIIAFASCLLATGDGSNKLLILGFVFLGLVPVGVGLFSRRKAVFQTLFLGYWF